MFEHGADRKTKAVCLDKGLDFDVGDVIGADLGPLSGNRLFRGGEVSHKLLNRPCAIRASTVRRHRKGGRFVCGV